MKNLNGLTPNNDNEVVHEGVTYDFDEIFQRRLFVTGTQPTNFDTWDRVNLLVQQRLGKQGSGGKGQALYYYGDAKDIEQFHQFKYPYYLDVQMVATTDKDGKPMNLILFADFANVQEIDLVPRKSPNTAKSSSTTTPSTNK